MTVDWDKAADNYPLDFGRNSLKRALDIAINETAELGTAAELGCGPGNFTIPLSGVFRKVYASDMSANMLARLEEACAGRGIGNVEPILSDALELELPERCDLAFSSMCPGVSGIAGLEKLDSLSKDLCIYITFDRVPDMDAGMLERLGIEVPDRTGSLDFLSEFSQDHDLRTERIVDIRTWKDRREAEETYIRWTDGSDGTAERVREYFEDHDPAGTTRQTAKLIAYWHTERADTP